MKKKLFLVSVVVLVTILATIGCTSQPAQQQEQRIEFIGSALGSNNYVDMAGLGQLLASKHPWLRLDVIEGPGLTGVTFAMMTRAEEDGYTTKRIGGTCDPDYYMAANAMGPFDEKFPNIRDVDRVLGSYGWFLVKIYTLDPNIKTEKDLAGKRLAAGQPGQTGWGLLPNFYLKEIAKVDVQVDFMTPTAATEAMLDGKADAAVLNTALSTDFATVVMPAPYQQLAAAGKTPYWVSWSDDLVNTAESQGYTPLLLPVTVPANSLPSQPTSITVSAYHCNITAHKDFPEDLAYEFTKFWLENSAALVDYAAPAQIISKPQDIASDFTQDQVHPGAWKAYKELGLR
ncbi:TAXI family TRAP transporter solute-binding subunit [Chloroflexota bacterium]